MITPPPTTRLCHLQNDQTFIGINNDLTSIGIRWKSWLAEFENLPFALDVTDTTRQRALLLYYAGKEAHNITFTEAYSSG